LYAAVARQAPMMTGRQMSATMRIMDGMVFGECGSAGM
jgi:hypothetical protein